MTLTITLPDRIEQQLEQAATVHQLSVEEVAISLLDGALMADFRSPSPEEIVARIRALPANPQGMRPASGSLGEALRAVPGNPDFDVTAWQAEWAAVEAEMKRITRVNDIAEGRM